MLSIDVNLRCDRCRRPVPVRAPLVMTELLAPPGKVITSLDGSGNEPRAELVPVLDVRQMQAPKGWKLIEGEHICGACVKKLAHKKKPEPAA